MLCWLGEGLYLSELDKSIHLKSNFYDYAVIQQQPNLLKYQNLTEVTVLIFFLGLYHLIQNKEVANH